jgi:hypothetical protein
MGGLSPMHILATGHLYQLSLFKHKTAVNDSFKNFISEAQGHLWSRQLSYVHYLAAPITYFIHTWIILEALKREYGSDRASQCGIDSVLHGMKVLIVDYTDILSKVNKKLDFNQFLRSLNTSDFETKTVLKRLNFKPNQIILLRNCLPCQVHNAAGLDPTSDDGWHYFELIALENHFVPAQRFPSHLARVNLN